MAVDQHRAAEETLSDFLSSLRFGGELDEIGETCSRVELRQVISGAPNQPLRDWPILPDAEVEDLASEIVDYAAKDASSYPTPNRYVLVAYFAGDDYKFRRRSPTFLMRGLDFQSDNHVGPDDVSESEPATSKGLLTQLMRHSEALARTLVGSQANLLQMYREELHSARAQSVRAQEMHVELIGLLEEVHSEKHQRELEAKKEERFGDMQKEIFEDTRALLPAVVNKLGGRKVLPEKSTPKDEAIMRLMGSLDENQRDQIAQVLRPAQLATLMTLFESALESAKKKEDEEKARKAKNGKRTDTH